LPFLDRQILDLNDGGPLATWRVRIKPKAAQTARAIGRQNTTYRSAAGVRPPSLKAKNGAGWQIAIARP